MTTSNSQTKSQQYSWRIEYRTGIPDNSETEIETGYETYSTRKASETAMQLQIQILKTQSDFRHIRKAVIVTLKNN